MNGIGDFQGLMRRLDYLHGLGVTARANEGMVFPGVQKTTWSYDKEARLYYFHRFYDFQPDLNTSNTHVQAEILMSRHVAAERLIRRG